MVVWVRVSCVVWRMLGGLGSCFRVRVRSGRGWRLGCWIPRGCSGLRRGSVARAWGGWMSGGVSVWLGVERVEELHGGRGGRLSVAAVNGPAAVVVSGESSALDELLAV